MVSLSRGKGKDEAQERRVVGDMERTKGGMVIRSCQRAATGRRRGQLPRSAPGICGVEGARGCADDFFFRGRREQQRGSLSVGRKRDKGEGAGDVMLVTTMKPKVDDSDSGQ